MKKIILLASLMLTVSIAGFAQHKKATIPPTAKVISQGKKSPEYTVQPSGEIKPVSVNLQWRPLLSNKCIKHHSENEERIEQIKKEKTLLKKKGAAKTNDEELAATPTEITPVVGANFSGNTNTGNSPLDNSIAVSNGGRIISVANNSFEIYNADGQLTYSNSIDGFFNDPAITSVCDPVVIYDSGADKFIFFAQECSGNSSNTTLLICFSQTSNPNGNWWKYKLTGNPVGNNTWFDYPKLAVSNNELYITGNSFSNDGIFQEALLFQIQKSNGFNGVALNWQYWYDLDSAPFTLLPVSYGQQGNYGPGIYLVATESSGASNIDFFDLTDDMSASNETLNHFSIPTTAYSPAGNGYQFGTDTQLDNGDCRSLSGFYLNGIIHFVFHSDYFAGYNGINYNRLNVAAKTNTSSMFGLNEYEYAYPSVASFAKTTTDKSVMIGFGRTGESIYPEVRVVSCDDGMNWSASTLVKLGSGYSDYTASNGDPERWGDYTGISRKHNNAAATVWMNGMYGTTSSNWDTWIAEITGTSTTGIENLNASSRFQVYPNPVFQEFKTRFELAEKAEISIDIYDVQGKLVQPLFKGLAHAGINQFTFNKANLATGAYFVTITLNHQIIKNEQIIIAD
ncbi:MAG: T9SS type A sorting domain-containing protein [Saprospiraceae bacterium]|nr:T9SS type A sorting domain-containing protein [Saprospiraceae bacterium]MDZ4705387.1 T9SS type A sorting domain-containing protein [Saprospiraceae bacterium]